MKSQVRETTAVSSIFLLPVTPPPPPQIMMGSQQREDETQRGMRDARKGKKRAGE